SRDDRSRSHNFASCEAAWGAAPAVFGRIPWTTRASAAAGLIAGDEIVSVDGLPVAQIGGNEAYHRLHGRVGTQVHIVVRRTTSTNTYQWAATLIRTPT